MIRNKYLRGLKTGLYLFLGKKPLIKVEHILTYSCNLKCGFCGLYNQKVKELNKEEIKVLMEEFLKLGCLSWYFGGGEPLLHPDIKELVLYAKSLGYHTTMTTNSLLVPKNLSWLKNIDLIGVSLEGPKNIHERIRGKGTHALVLNALELLNKEKMNLYISTVLTRQLLENDHEGLRYLLNLSSESKIKISFLPMFKDQLNKQKIGSLITPEDIFKEGISILKDFKKENPSLLMMSWRTLKEYEKGIKPFKCSAGTKFCTIFPDGKISPCRFRKKYKIKELKRLNVDIKNIRVDDLCSCSTLCYLEYNNLFKHPLKSLSEIIRHY